MNIDKKVREVLEKIGFRKETRKTWFKQYAPHFDVQLKYRVSIIEYSCENGQWIRTLPKLYIYLAFVEVYHTIEESKTLYKLTKKAFKDKEKIAKQLEGIIEVI